MKSSNYLTLSTSPQTQPTKKLRKFASLTLRQRRLCEKLRRNITGKELDPETGLYYYGARYLDPKTGRWISGVFNYVNLHVYHYAGNNPVRYVDPDGRTTNFRSSGIRTRYAHLASREWGNLPGR
jgi:RHS repeat-associated protein